jgi:hypothetical protein
MVLGMKVFQIINDKKRDFLKTLHGEQEEKPIGLKKILNSNELNHIDIDIDTDSQWG